MARRRSREDIQRARAASWINLKESGYAGFTHCSICHEERYCRGKKLTSRVCEECFMKHAPV